MLRSAGRLLRKMRNMAIRDRARLMTVNPVDRAIEYAPIQRRRKKLALSERVHSFIDEIEGVKCEPLALYELGAPDSVVTGNMGHSNGTTKGKYYQRVTMRAKCLAADLLTESLEDFKAPEKGELRNDAERKEEGETP